MYTVENSWFSAKIHNFPDFLIEIYFFATYVFDTSAEKKQNSVTVADMEKWTYNIR